ncbi:TetR/AcrR family transcriptional regulator [Enterococcus sp. DIV0756]|uniref:TetR/AcrR family transcriptional regulator n=1 Tax=Enterococcus sp. DIV0756 TaxID=2774636 RepID=UPI003F23A7C5
MPKVSDDYIAERKAYILKCASEVLIEKPLFQVTMRDIIKKTGFSQGAIYRYYANIDEIFIALINNIPIYYDLDQEVNTLLKADIPNEEMLSSLLLAIGRYLEELLLSVGGKLCSELLVYSSCDEQKRENVLPQLIFKQNLEQVQDKIIHYFLTGVQEGVIQLTVPVEQLNRFIAVTVDGILGHIAFSNLKKEQLVNEIRELFQTLALSAKSFFK